MGYRRLPHWLQGYLAYTTGNESPEIFHTWVGLAVVSAALARRTWLDMGHFRLYPNIYMVLVSPSGLCKKTTSLKLGARLLQEAVPSVRTAPNSTSREKLIDELKASYASGVSALLAVSEEFGTFFTTSGVDMVTFLTDIYDSPDRWTHATRGRDSVTVMAPYLTLMAGATPEWFPKSPVALDSIGIGLAGRMIFVYSDQPRPAVPIPRLTSEQRALRELLVQDLAGPISLIEGEFTFNQDAEEWYNQWYLSRFGQRDYDARLSGYYERKPMHVLKIAMLLSACRKEATVLEVRDLEDSLAVLGQIEENLIHVYSGIGKNPYVSDIEQVLVTLANAPSGLTLGELLKRHSASVRKIELVEILDTLIAMGKVRVDGNRFCLT